MAGGPQYGSISGALTGAPVDPAWAQWLKAVQSGISPDQISTYAGAVGAGQTPEQAADPYGLQGQRDIAFSDTNSYDYRSDPSFLALQRAYEFQTSEASRQAAQQTGNLDVLQPIAEDDINANQTQALRGVDANAEGRGIYQSSERLQNRANTVGDYGRQLSAVQLSGAMQRGNVQSDLAAALAEIQRRQADTQAQYATPPLPGAPTGAF